MKKLSIILFITALLVSGATMKKKPDVFKASIKESKLTWSGKRVTYGHYGSVDLKSGELEFDGDILLGGEFVINMVSIRNLDLDDKKKSSKLVNHLKSEDFFDAKKFPEAKFMITSVKKEVTENGNYSITGNLTIRGNTHSETFSALVARQGESAKASGKVVFDRTKYNVRYGSGSFFDDLGDKMIHNNIEIEVELVTYK